ncbi:MAG: hypothetical protein JWP97_4823, partial [Labilithrix sp.]|nr:hypothetical protein [Labilithrix sp.]
MSSASRAPGDEEPAAPEEPSNRPASPGRYSLSTGGSTEMAAVRIDSTRMAAVRPPDSAKPSVPRPSPSSSGNQAVVPPHPPVAPPAAGTGAAALA